MVELKVPGTKPKGHPFPLISWGIRLIEWSDISHVALELPDNRIYHGYFNKVKYEDLDKWKEEVAILHTYEFKIPKEMYDAMLLWCDGYEGRKSGYFPKIFGVIIPHLSRVLFGKYLHNTFVQGMKKNATCSELLRYLAVRYWNFEVPKFPYPENFTTQDVLKLLENNSANKTK